MNTGRKDDRGKARWDLIPLHPLLFVIDVLTYGAKKYEPDNWKQVDNPQDRYYAAAMRHIAAWRCEEFFDPETNLPHLAHAVCCLLFLMWFDIEEGLV